jgi:hypothetical protein
MTPHDPAPPSDDEPPAALWELSRTIDHPDVVSAGLTTTRDGAWALYVVARRGAGTPIAEIERAAGGYPVVYERAPDELPVARPAYPDRGE